MLKGMKCSTCVFVYYIPPSVIAPTHIEAFQKHDDVQVEWLCDLIQKKSDDLAARYSVPNTTTDAKALLASDVDLVSICTDHASHAELAVAALQAGKHVLCEKALAHNQDGLTQMIQAADAHPDLLFTGIFQHRFDAVNRRIRQLIADGALGRMLTAGVQMRCRRTHDYYSSDSWRGTWDHEGGSVLINQAIHYIDLLRWTMGGVTSLTGMHANLTHGESIETEDTAVAALRFTNGALGTIEATCSSHINWEATLTYHGTDGSIELRHDKPVKIIFKDEARAEEVTRDLEQCRMTAKVDAAKDYYGTGHAAQIADLLDALRNGSAPYVTARSAARTVDLVLSLYQSNKTAKPVTLRTDL